MDHFVARERAKALMVITKASVVLGCFAVSLKLMHRSPGRYKTTPLTFIHHELAFDSLEQACDFLADHSAAHFANPGSADGQKILDCKLAGAQLPQVFEERYRKVLIKGAI